MRCNGTETPCKRCISAEREHRIRMAVREFHSQQNSGRRLTLQAIATKHGIKKSTLHNHLSGKLKKFVRGWNRVFNDDNEEIILAKLRAIWKKENSMNSR